MATSAAVQAQFTYTTNNGTITLTGYTGAGGAVLISNFVTSIGDGAFENCTTVTSVTIPDSVTNIGDSAFSQTGMTSVVIPSSVTCIGEYEFANSYSLTSAIIPGSVTSIPEGAFDQCTSLTNATIPASTTNIGDYAFFSTSLTSVTIPEGIPSIGDSAFSECYRLTNITIPSSVTKIGNGAFWLCENLTRVAIPDSITSIGAQAFYECSALTSVAIPASVTTIGPGAFGECSKLTAITVDADNPGYSSTNGVLFDKSQSTLIQFPSRETGGSYTIPGSVVTIGDYAFEGASLSSVMIPNGVSNIGLEAFNDCQNLTNVTIPSSVTSIGDEAFQFCARLTAITVDTNNPAYSSVNGVLFNTTQTTLIQFPPVRTGGNYTIPASVTNIGGGGFADCSSLTSITIPNSVISIEEDAFFDCSGLTNITIPSGIISIGQQAFFGCSGLTNITIPASVTNIGSGAFNYCSNLTSIYFTGNAPDPTLSGGLFYFSKPTVYYLPGTSGSAAFCAYNGLTAIELTAIAISGNPTNGAVPFTVGFTSAGLDSAGHVISNWNWTFGDGSISTAENPSHRYTTGGTFSVALFETNNNGVPVAGSGMSITASPPTVQYAANPTNGASPLTVQFSAANIDSGGNPVTSWNWNFGDGSSGAAQSPSHVYTAQGSYFPSLIATNNLSIPVLGSGPSAITAYEFTYTTNGDNTLTIKGCTGPSGDVTDVNIPTMINSLRVTCIGEDAFSNYSNLCSVIIPNSVASIGEGAFDSCSSLTSVTIPASVTNIGEDAFFDSGLTSVTFANGVTSIGEYAFNGCVSLTNITIPNSVTSIAAGAFRQAFSLPGVTIPESVTNIGTDVFGVCYGLEAITVAPANAVYSSLNGVLFAENATILIQYPGGICGGYTIPDSVTNISVLAFDTASLTSVTIPNSVISIGDSAFRDSTSLSSVTIGSNVTSIGDSAFSDCTSLASVIIPNSVTSIGEEAFYYCTGLTSVTIPASVTNIGSVVFPDCTNMIAINVATNNPSYSSEAGVLFNKSQTTLIECPGLETGSFRIPNGVTSIGAYAFTGCDRLISVTIPNSVSNIVDYALSDCFSLTSVYFNGNAPTADSTVFSGDTNATVYYYSGTTGWSSTFAGRPAMQLNPSKQPGSLQVTLSPAPAVSAGGEWRINGGAFQTNGATVTELSPTNVTVSFKMIPEFATPSNQIVTIIGGQTNTLVATYLNTNRPILAILSPKSGQTVSNAAFTVTGTARDNVAVSNVFFQLGGGANWTLASPSNSTWSNWTADVTLTPGTNTISAYAVDTSSNASPVTNVSFFYLVTNQLDARTVGSGKLSPNYSDAWLDIGRNYSMTAEAGKGFKFTKWTGSITNNSSNLTFRMESNLTLIANFVDDTPPSISITSPTANQRWSNSIFTATGAAKDNVQVSDVWCQLNGGGWALATNGNSSWNNWTATLTNLESANLFQAYSVDTTGNCSPTNKVEFLYIPSAPLTVTNAGNGNITPVDNGKMLAIGTNYTLTATAAKNWLFSNWVGGTALPYSVLSESSNYTFRMQSNLVLTANFVTNPFLAVAGIYSGLFYPTDGETNAVTEASSGFISATIATNSTGAYSARVMLDGETNSFSGSFDLTGTAQTNLARKGKTPVSVTLSLDFNPADALISGSVSNEAAGWDSMIQADRAVFSATANPATNYAGHFTLLFPPEANAPLESPDGYGYAAVTNTLAGISTLGGALADGTPFLWSAPMARNGRIPLYQSLYSGKGSLLGWIYFTNEPPQNLSTNSWVSWIKPAIPNTLYPFGFTNLIGVLGSPYTNTAKSGVPVLNLPNASLLLTNGDLTNGFLIYTNIGTNLTSHNTLTNLDAGNTNLSPTNHLAIAINTNNGVVTITFRETGAKTNTVAHGAVLQNQPQTNAAGYFLGTNESGSFILGPD